ncbi:putative ribonuclease H-like domain-containing protein [Tanacetum coccineum]
MSQNKGTSLSLKDLTIIGNPQQDLKDKGVIDSGCSRHMTGNKSILQIMKKLMEDLLPLEVIPKEGKLLGKKNSVLFTDTECVVLSPDFKLTDERNQSNGSAGTKACDNVGKARVETVPGKDYILLPLWTQDPTFSFSPKDSPDAGFKPLGEEEKKDVEDLGNEGGNPSKEGERINQEKGCIVLYCTNNINTASDGNNTNNVNVVSSTVNAVGIEVNDVDPKTSIKLLNDPNMPELEDIVYSDDDEDVGAEADMNNLVDSCLTSKPEGWTKILTEHAMFCSVQQRTNHKDFQNCLLACFLLQEEPKKVVQALKDPGWIEAMQEELLQFKLQEVWTLQDWLHKGIHKKKELIMMRDEVFAPVARIEAIRLFLAYALFKNFVVYQMDVKSAFLYEKIEEEVYVYQPPGFEDPDFPDRVYKVEKALYRLHQALRAWYETLSTYLLDNGFQRGKIDKTLFIKRDQCDILLVQVSMGELTIFLGLEVKQKEDQIFISQDKYVTEILKKFGFSDVKIASTPMETHKPLLKDSDGEDVDEHLHRSMIGSLMYLTSSRPNIMFAVCTCARFQVNPKILHLHVVKRIFRYLKGHPKLGLWYHKDSPFDLVAFTDNDYAGASLDRKSITKAVKRFPRRSPIVDQVSGLRVSSSGYGSK